MSCWNGIYNGLMAAPKMHNVSSKLRQHTAATAVAEVREPPQIAHADGETQSRHGEVESAGPCATVFSCSPWLSSRIRHDVDVD